MRTFREIGFPILVLLLLFPASMLSQDTKENAEFKLAVNLYNDKIYDLAAEQLRRFIENYPNSSQGVQARFYLGLAQMELKQFEQARIVFQNFALSYPDNPQAPDAWWKVGEAYVALDNPLEAASAFERLRVFHPKSKRAAEALLKSAHYFKRAGVPDRAKKVLRTLVQEYPTSESVLDARFELSETFIEEGNYDQARSELKRVIAKTQSSNLKAKALLMTGESYRKQEKLEKAEEIYTEAIESFRKTAVFFEASLAVGLLQQDLGKYSESITSFKNVLSDTSLANTAHRHRALLAIGKSYFELKDFQNAGSYFEQLLRQNPEGNLKADVLRFAAMASESQKDYRRAIQFYQKLTTETDADSDRRVGLVGAARMSRLLGDSRAALSSLESFVRGYPKDSNAPRALYTMAEVFESDASLIDGKQKAIESSREVISRYPMSRLVDDALFHIGQVQEAEKDFDQALRSYEELLKRYPASPFVQIARERIRSIKTFEPTPTNSSLSKLANLLANLIASESKGESAFNLGEIYFNDLKDYGSAARMFTSAIENKVPEPYRARAFYLRARAYQLLSEKNRTPQDSALHAYEQFLRAYPSDQFSGNAAAEIALLKIAKSKPGSALLIAEEFVLKYPGATKGDAVVLSAGDTLLSSGGYDRASLAYKQVLSWFPATSLGEDALYRLGAALEKSGRPDSAQAVFDSYLQRYPAGTYSAQVLTARARAAIKLQRFETAIDLFRKLEDGFYYAAETQQSSIKLAKTFANAGQLDSAIVHCRRILEEADDDLFEKRSTLEPRVLLAKAYSQKGDNTSAKRFYLAALRDGQINSSQATKGEVLASLSRLARDEGDLESALSFLRGAAQTGSDPGQKRELAELYFQTSDYRSAVAQFTELIDIAESSADKINLERQLIISQIRLGNLPEAEARTKLFSKNFKDVEEALAEIEFERGKYYFDKQNFNASLNVLQRLVKDYDKTRFAPTAQYWIGKIYESTGQTQEALKKYNEILGKYPRAEIRPRVYLALGNVSYRTENFDTAVVYFKKVVDDSSYARDLLPFAMNNLIEAYKTVGLLDAALQLTRSFVEKFPEDESIQDKKIDIGVLYEKLGYHDQSVIHLQNLLDEADADAEGEIRYYIGEAFFGKGDYDRAILEFLKVPYLVTKKSPVDWTANAFYMCGQAYEKMGKFEESIGMYKQIVDRPGIDQTFKAAALKEMDRVNALVKRPSKKSAE